MRYLLITLLFGFSVSGTAQSIQLRLASDVWPPFTNRAGEKAIAKALVEEALNRASINEHTKILEFGDVISGIQDGTYDGSAALWKNAERESILVFSDPYLENRLILVGRKGSDVNATSFKDLSGKRIGVVGHYAYGEMLEMAKEIVLIEGNNDQQNLDLLLKEEVDYILVDDLLIQYLVSYQSEEVGQYLAIGSNALITRTLHFAVRKELDKAEFIVDQFNRYIHEMAGDGTYNRILELNWIRTDVDGDGRLELVLGGDRAGMAPPSYSYDLMLEGANVVQKDGDRYYIDGKVYESWQSVPQNYKAPLKYEDVNKPGATLRFKF